uniref:Putative capsid n=1 Tax=uncultured virus TaxID=340016 RepID=A0A1D8MK47_9VIRU|nr:putative capsid [uncultured virus]
MSSRNKNCRMSKRARGEEHFTVRKRARSSGYVAPSGRAYAKIPYEVSQAGRFWRIKKDLPADQYWKKRYFRRRITGRGDYKWSSKRNTGSNIGGYLGSKAGQFIGGAAHNLFSALTGLGDYSVKRNVLMGNNLPQIVNNTGPGGTTIRFQEYLGDVYTGGTDVFKIDSYLINAANPKTFPWLSQIAANYEQYDIEGMVFSFTSTSADALNSTNTALGTVMMATQYDVLDEPFNSKTEMLNYEFSTSCKPSHSNLHMIECDPRQTTINELYCLYNQEVPPNGDPRLYHLGKFSIATTGFQHNQPTNIGQLQVTYQVRLLKPKLYTSLGLTTETYTAYAQGAADTFTDVIPLGDYRTEWRVIYSNSDIKVAAETENGPAIIQLPQSTARLTYLVDIWWYGVTKADETRIPNPIAGASHCEVIGQIRESGTHTTSDRVAMSFFVQTDGSGKQPEISLTNSGAVLPLGDNRHMQINITGVSSAVLPSVKQINSIPG